MLFVEFAKVRWCSCLLPTLEAAAAEAYDTILRWELLAKTLGSSTNKPVIENRITNAERVHQRLLASHAFSWL